MVCSDPVPSGAGSAALVGDSGGHAPFLVFLTQHIFSSWSKHSELVTALRLSSRNVDSALRHVVGFLGCLFSVRSWTQS